jgi:hypothetical protein
MLKISINKTASAQMEYAALNTQILPLRLQAAQMRAINAAEEKLKNRLPEVSRAARYLEVKAMQFGPVGAKLVISPAKSSKSGKNGRNVQIASSIVLTGKKGGGYIYPKKKDAMKLRSESIAEGYGQFYKRVKKARIKSKRPEVRELARQVVVDLISQSLTKEGFGKRGGVSRPSTDIPRG